MSQNISWLGNDYLSVPYIQLPKTGGGVAQFDDTTIDSSVAASADDILSGKQAVVNGSLLTGTGSGGTVNLKPYAIRPDAELLQTYTYDKLLVEDLSIAMPSYSTTAKTLVASASLSPTITVSYADYDYREVVRMLAYPIYKDGTSIVTGRLEYWAGILMYDLVEIPGNAMQSASGTKYTSRTTSFYQSGAFYRELYYSSASALTVYATASYGIYETSTAPAISSSTMTVKSPVLAIRGHATYLKSAVWSTMQDIRYQYIIEVYRAPKGNLNIDGWGSRQAFLHVAECGNSTNRNLT